MLKRLTAEDLRSYGIKMNDVAKAVHENRKRKRNSEKEIVENAHGRNQKKSMKKSTKSMGMGQLKRPAKEKWFQHEMHNALLKRIS